MKSTPALIRYSIVALLLLVGTFYGLYQLTLTGNTDPNDMAYIENYLSVTGRVDGEINDMATELFIMAESGAYDMGKLTNILFQIEELKKEITQEYENFKELEQRSRLMLETLRKLVLIVYEPAQTTYEERNVLWRQHVNDLSRLSESRTQIIKKMLEAEELEYNENSDGSLSYWKP